jgi:hypothetical protein
MTDFLSIMFHVGQPYASIHDLLVNAVSDTGATRLVDLCSGGGAPAVEAHAAVRLRAPIDLLLTDRYPNSTAVLRYAPHYLPEPVDVLVDPIPEGFRTMFTAFHHFDEVSAQSILKAAVRDRQPIAVFEATERSLRGILLVLCVPLFVWVLTPWIRPRRWSRFLWTYLIPLIPACAFWDGIVSILRSYTVAELSQLASNFPEYDWVSGRVSGRFGARVTYLIGRPR